LRAAAGAGRRPLCSRSVWLRDRLQVL